jgi:hypothetical protein
MKRLLAGLSIPLLVAVVTGSCVAAAAVTPKETRERDREAGRPAGPADEDCNGNGIPDATDIDQGTSLDCNGNLVPDECDTDVEFTAHVIDDGTDGAHGVFAVDLDGDADVDVLSASHDDHTIAWYENTDGQGTFGTQQRLTGAALFAVSVFGADLDGDGDNDVLSASALDDTIGWFENLDASREFSARQVITDEAEGAWSVFAVDVDADGDLDVLSASQNDQKIAWYENTDGAATFGPQRILTTAAAFAVSVYGEDLDGDGDTDILSAAAGDGPNAPQKISWFENSDGLGTFGPPQLISADVESASGAVATDLDGDGDADVVSASRDDAKIAWYEKNDDLDDFGAQQIISDAAPLALAVLAADVDADGDTDVLAAYGSHVVWYENEDGAGSFGPERIVTASANTATSLFAIDVDGDGDMDILSASVNDDTIAWYENVGDDCNANTVPDECEPDCNANGVADGCDLSAGASRDCNVNGIPDECDIAQQTSDDCTGDGIPDECEPDCNANSTADSCDIDDQTSDDCTGNGIPDECEPDCNANSAADSCDIDDQTSDDCTGNGIPDECEPDCNANSAADSCDIDAGTSNDCNGNDVPDECDVATGSGHDCDGDGLLDECQTLLLFTPHVITTQADFARTVFAGDVDADGDVDVLSGSFLDDKIAWYENTDGDGTFGAQQVISNAPDGPHSVFGADLDGDRDMDVLSASVHDDAVSWFENTLPTGVFGPRQVISTEGNGVQSVVGADLDGDDDVDVAAASLQDDEIAWYENTDGAGTFGPQQLISSTADAAYAVFAADLDGDQDLDVLSASRDDDTIAWYRNRNGLGGFGAPLIISTTADEATSVFAADVDGDGDADVLSASRNDDTLAWYENTDGAGTFGTEQIVSFDGNGNVDIFAADVDGDGDADVIAASFFDNTVAWYENTDGAGSFGSRRVLSNMAAGAFAVFAADIDGDGDTDVLSASQIDDAIRWYENRSDDCNGNGVPDACDIATGTSADCSGNGVPDSCEPDCNGNGVPDSCDIELGTSGDCNLNAFPDECEPDCDANGQPDGCDPDCNDDGIPDACDVDCNANGVPDGCEPDCNGNGVADECDIDAGTSIDCNDNGVPDECDSGCPEPCDTDGDGCWDPVDVDPLDPNVCADADGDNCDDCTNGPFDPTNDGQDTDGDDICDLGDCRRSDASTWLEPSPVTSLTLAKDATTLLSWEEPDDPGALIVWYDALRSSVASDFHGPAICLESDDTDLSAEDSGTPDVGAVFSYLIRVANDCPLSNGTLGNDSDGIERTGRECP